MEKTIRFIKARIESASQKRLHAEKACLNAPTAEKAREYEIQAIMYKDTQNELTDVLWQLEQEIAEE